MAGILVERVTGAPLADRTTTRDKAEQPWFFGASAGWGLMMAVPAAGAGPRVVPAGEPRGYGWDGGSGTTWRTDPVTGLTGILLTQRMMTSPDDAAVSRDFWSAARAALA